MANKTSFNSGRTLDAATENIEILTGARGNKLDKAITLRELGELGLANLVKVGSSYKASVGSSSSDSNASSNVEWPSSPENVSASGAFNVILVQWDQPRYKGHQYAEIWRAEEDNLSKAVWIGATAAVIYPDPIGGDAKAYYWVRFVNSNGDKGAFNSQSGIYAETSVDVAQLLEALTEKITADQLTQDLLTPISQINSINIGLLQTNQILENARSELQTAIDQANTDRISGDNGLSNSILSLSTTVTDNNTAATTRMNSIESAYKAADTALTSSVSDLTKTVTDNNTAATTRMNSIESAYKAADTTTNSSLITLMQTVSNNYAALSQSIASLDSAYKSADTTISSAISSEASTRASADTALSNTISSVSAVANAKNKTFLQTTAPTSGMITGDLWFDTSNNNTPYRYSGSAWVTTIDPRIASNAAAITAEQTARADADTALSNTITTVSATANAKNKTYYQTAAPSSGMTAGDLWFDSDDNNTPYRYSGSAWVTTVDPRTAANAAAITTEQTARANGDSANATAITSLSATVDGHTSSIQTNALAIATTNSTYSAQWSTKTTVAGLTGGFGIYNDGTNTRFTVAANKFAIVDPAGDGSQKVPFIVSGGKVVMANAFIDTAYIQSLASAQITAEKINSLNLTSVNISGGTLTLGSGDNIMMANGGALGIGKGGPYGGWGYGWHTIIYNDGGIYTDRLHASSGDFTGYVHATSGYFENVTIAENCDVRGTVYANKIVGDVVAIRTLNALYSVYQQAGGTALTAFSCNIAASSKARVIDIGSISFQSTTSGVYYVAAVYLNGSAVYTASTNAAAGVGLSFKPPVLDLPTGVNVSVTVTFKYLALMQSNVSVTVYPKNTGTFI